MKQKRRRTNKKSLSSGIIPESVAVSLAIAARISLDPRVAINYPTLPSNGQGSLIIQKQSTASDPTKFNCTNCTNWRFFVKKPNIRNKQKSPHIVFLSWVNAVRYRFTLFFQYLAFTVFCLTRSTRRLTIGAPQRTQHRHRMEFSIHDKTHAYRRQPQRRDPCRCS